jgi:GR25 family glycosyltransferase involved in LPS biosynthesis
MIPIAFINLDRRPDRRHSVESQLAEQKVDQVFRFRAKDAREYVFTPDELSVFTRADFIHDRRIAAPIMCNFLCHYDLWDFMTEKRIPMMVILQDDVILRPNFAGYVYSMSRYLPDDAEVVWLAVPEQVRRFMPYERAGVVLDEVTPYVSRLHHSVNPCSLAYLITLEGARRLKEHALTQGVHRATDFWMNEYLVQKNIYYVSTEILARDEPEFKSDIF